MLEAELTNTGNYRVHTFNSSSNFVVSSTELVKGAIQVKVDYIVVGGGGGGIW